MYSVWDAGALHVHLRAPGRHSGNLDAHAGVFVAAADGALVVSVLVANVQEILRAVNFAVCYRRETPPTRQVVFIAR